MRIITALGTLVVFATGVGHTARADEFVLTNPSVEQCSQCEISSVVRKLNGLPRRVQDRFIQKISASVVSTEVLRRYIVASFHFETQAEKDALLKRIGNRRFYTEERLREIRVPAELIKHVVAKELQQNYWLGEFGTEQGCLALVYGKERVAHRAVYRPSHFGFLKAHYFEEWDDETHYLVSHWTGSDIFCLQAVTDAKVVRALAQPEPTVAAAPSTEPSPSLAAESKPTQQTAEAAPPPVLQEPTPAQDATVATHLHAPTPRQRPTTITFKPNLWRPMGVAAEFDIIDGKQSRDYGDKALAEAEAGLLPTYPGCHRFQFELVDAKNEELRGKSYRVTIVRSGKLEEVNAIIPSDFGHWSFWGNKDKLPVWVCNGVGSIALPTPAGSADPTNWATEATAYRWHAPFPFMVYPRNGSTLQSCAYATWGTTRPDQCGRNRRVGEMPELWRKLFFDLTVEENTHFVVGKK